MSLIRCRVRVLRVILSLSAFTLFSIIAHLSAVAAPCGDANNSNQTDIADAVYLINYIFASGPAPQDDAQGDFNCSGQTDIADAVMMINFIFASGPAPCSAPGCVVGVLLAGDPDSLAVAATSDYGPFAAGSAEIDSTGFLKTRLSALFNPDATAGEVNAALNLVNGKLTWMTPGDLAVTIRIAPVATRAEADSVASLLVQTGAFLFVFPAYTAGLDGRLDISELPPTGQSKIEHLINLRMPAAWNAERRAELVNQKTTVLVPDYYSAATPHPEIPSQVFLPGKGVAALLSTLLLDKDNHGFQVAGIIGAKHDDRNATGTHPNDGLLDIQSLMGDGLSFAEFCSEMVTHFPAGRFVLNTSLGWDDFDTHSRLHRAVEGIRWRSLVLSRQDDFIHVASAGNEGRNQDGSGVAYFSAPWTVAASFDSPYEVFLAGTLGPLDSLYLSVMWNHYAQGNPFMAVKLNNVLMVGASDTAGARAEFSNLFADVRALGVDVSAPCLYPNNVCQPSGDGLLETVRSGTSNAAPQIAGLAAYMLNLDPTLTNAELKDIIIDSYKNSPNDGFVDAYAAVLAVDPTLADANIRFALLDVADAAQNEIPDNVFDEHDIQFFLTKFAEYEQIRDGIPNAPADYSRFDLNGDGFTGGTSYVSKFDLDINYPPQYGTVTAPFGVNELTLDENTLVDLDILCYYAHSPLYTGSESARAELLIDCPCAQVETRDAQCLRCDVPINEILTFADRYAVANALWGSLRVVNCFVKDDSYGGSLSDPFGTWADTLEVALSCPQSGAAGGASNVFDIRNEFDTLRGKWTYEATAFLQAVNADTSSYASATVLDSWLVDLSDISCSLQTTVRVKCTAKGSSELTQGTLLAFSISNWVSGSGVGFYKEDFKGVLDTTMTYDVESDTFFYMSLQIQTQARGETDSTDASCSLTVVVEPKPTAAKARIRNAEVAPLPESSLLDNPVPAATTVRGRRLESPKPLSPQQQGPTGRRGSGTN